MARLSGKSAIVTGGAIGIGRHYSQALAAEGAQVMIADIKDGAGLAAEIAANPPLVVHGIKAVLDHTRSAAVHDSLRYVAAWNSAFLPSKDLTEAITAVFEKRTPDFTGD